jgi:hypothetical protein
MLKFIFYAVSIFFLTSSSFAEKGIWIYGSLECGRLLASCDKGKLEVDCQTQTFFVLGYITGKSVGTRIQYTTKDQDSVKYAMIKYCRENPLQDTGAFADDLFRTLSR